MKKIVCLIIFSLMIATVFPVIGLPIQTENIKNLNIEQPYSKALTPGYAQISLTDTLVDASVVCGYPEKIPATVDDIVISMLEQVDETIYLSYLENLTDVGPRLTGSDACEAAAGYIYNQFKTMGLAVRYHHWDNGDISSDNVEATINGTDKSSDEIYIICAHYDTVYDSPGADDDASGTVAVMIAALIMSQYQFNHTIKFVAFSGEEQGLVGSRFYAYDAAIQGWNIVGVLNADMISFAATSSDGNKLIVFENAPSEWLYTYTYNINSEYADYIHLTLYQGGVSSGSDHKSFWNVDYDALFYAEYGDTPYYHTSHDNIDNINATYAVKNIRLILATLVELSEARFFNNPPTKPILTGPSSGIINQAYNLSIVTTEPDGENVYYLIKWGDGQVDEWVGPFNSSVTAVVTHQWTEAGSYTIQAKVKDIFGAESDWGTLDITMPLNIESQSTTTSPVQIERFFSQIDLLFKNLGLRLFRA